MGPDEDAALLKKRRWAGSFAFAVEILFGVVWFSFDRDFICMCLSVFV